MVTDTRGKVVATATGAHAQLAFKEKRSGVYMISVSGSVRSFVRKIAIP